MDGRVLADRREPIVIALHKPAGYVTTRSDPQGRRTIYDLLPAFDRFVFPVGRLDKDTSGLLIVTDDHRLGETLTNPDHHVPKTYEAIVDREPDEEALRRLREGLDIGRGEVTRPAQVSCVTRDAHGVTITLTVAEGRNRQVRRMLAAVGLETLSLKRTAIGGYALGDLPSGLFALLDASQREALARRG